MKLLFRVAMMAAVAGACISAPVLAGTIDNANIKRGDALLADQQFDAAAQAYSAALEASQPTGERSYYTAEVYRVAATAQSRLGFVELERGNVQAAGEEYRTAINNLREAYKKHAEMDELKNTAKRVVSDEVSGFLKGQLGKLLSKLPSNQVTRRFDLFGRLSETVEELVEIPPPEVELGARRVGEETDYHEIRIPVIPDTEYFRYIGRVRTKRGSCTGSLVGPNLVLTNAHCIIERGGSDRRKEGPYTFRREWLYDVEVYEVETFYTSEGQQGGWNGENRNDWALLVVRTEGENGRLPGTYLTALSDLSELSQFGPKVPSVFLAGYAGDLNRGLYMTMHSGCRMDPSTVAASQPDAYHDCQRYGGLSGAPIVHLDASGKPYVVSIHAGVNSGRQSDFKSRAVPPANWYPTLRRLLGH